MKMVFKKVITFPVKVVLVFVAIPTAVCFAFTVIGGAVLAVGGEWVSTFENYKANHIKGTDAEHI